MPGQLCGGFERFSTVAQQLRFTALPIAVIFACVVRREPFVPRRGAGAGAEIDLVAIFSCAAGVCGERSIFTEIKPA